jgi:D-beta-D-heptose 7-phosphate kinase/D-beta-D-heptose 1-phosphate adenosyltransferase
MRVLVIGDVLLDRDVEGQATRLAPDAPVPVVDVQGVRERPGGAGLAAVLLARDGLAVTLASATGTDDAGERLAELLTGRVRWVPLATAGRTRTVTRVRSGRQSLIRLDEPAAPPDPRGEVDTAALARAVRAADAVLVADYGAGLTGHPQVRQAIRARRPGVPVVWDPHPRGSRPVPGCTVVTPNRAEALLFAERDGLAGEPGATAAGATAAAALRGPAGPPAPDELAVRLREYWQAQAVAVTAGETGVFCALADSPPLFTPTPSQCPGDPVGAGDRFAGTLAATLAGGAVITEAVAVAVDDVAAWLWSGGVASTGSAATELPGAAIDSHAASAEPRAAAPAFVSGSADRQGLAAAIALADQVRARGGTVVATGGCFDVLHAGHVESLQAARRLGDCLMVLLNSDDSIRRIKGSDRPVNRVEDRRRVLAALDCVDAVAVFDADTPADALEALRPHIWAKGGDYVTAGLPETHLLPRWAGRVVVLPYLRGRSTTTILDRAKETRT